MAVAYPIPPWLHGVSAGEIGQLTAESLRAGAQLQMEQARLSQQAQQNEMEMAAREAASQRAEMRAQTERDMEKAYKDASLGLRAHELGQEQQRINFQVESASRKFQAQQKYQQLVESGVEPTQALLQVGPELGMSMAGAAALQKPTFAPRVTEVGGQKLFETAPGQWRFPPTAGRATLPETVRIQERRMEAEQRALQAAQDKDSLGQRAIAAPDPSKLGEAGKAAAATYRARAARIQKLDAAIERLIGNAEGGGGPSGPDLPDTGIMTGRMFKDKSGKSFLYKGQADDPLTDRNPQNWQEQ